MALRLARGRSSTNWVLQIPKYGPALGTKPQTYREASVTEETLDLYESARALTVRRP